VYWVQERGLNYLQFPMLSGLDGFFHGIFLRRISDQGNNPEDFNLGMGCGTPDHQVLRNRRRMLALFGTDCVGVYARQTHSTHVATWNPNPIPVAAVRLDGDALITNQDAGALVIQTADCQAVIIIDPVRRVVANIHSGWRGSIGNIIGRTIRAMTVEYTSRPRDLLCGIGPSLGPCCAEFVNYRREFPASFWHYRSAGDHFDFWNISRDQLQAAGVPPDHISVSGICTKCNRHLFFSYRGNPQTGRFATVVGIGKSRENNI
jgi:purine-nucleoside/S-methyl-5'-thioadenosine phosphorylase / adenosine deaminase